MKQVPESQYLDIRKEKELKGVRVIRIERRISEKFKNTQMILITQTNKITCPSDLATKVSWIIDNEKLLEIEIGIKCYLILDITNNGKKKFKGKSIHKFSVGYEIEKIKNV